MKFLLWLFLLCMIGGGIWRLAKVVKSWRSYVVQHPAVEYRPAASAQGWHWADPPVGVALQKVDQAEQSLLQLPDIRSTNNVAGTLVGCAAILGGIALLIYSFILAPSDRVIGPIFVSLFTIICGRLMFDLDSRLVAIEVERDRVMFIVRYGIIFFHRIIFNRDGVDSFSGKVQAALAMEKYQPTPHYYVFVHRGSSAKRFITDCDPSQGSWLAAGLENWRQSGVPAPNQS
jgi:hypothetical protein